jgi:hypothetical protein
MSSTEYAILVNRYAKDKVKKCKKISRRMDLEKGYQTNIGVYSRNRSRYFKIRQVIKTTRIKLYSGEDLST